MRSARPTYLLAILFSTVPVLMAFPGCSATAVPTAAKLVIVQGHLQSGAVGSTLPTSVVMRVIGTDGGPVEKIPVSLSIMAGGGTVDPATSLSDANGEVKAKWTLGPNSQVQTLSATAPGVEPVQISALGILPSDLIIAQGNNQSAKAGAALPVQLVIRVTGWQQRADPRRDRRDGHHRRRRTDLAAIGGHQLAWRSHGALDAWPAGGRPVRHRHRRQPRPDSYRGDGDVVVRDAASRLAAPACTLFGLGGNFTASPMR